MNETYTPDEVAKLFKISKHTVYELIKREENFEPLKLAIKCGLNKMRSIAISNLMETTPKTRPSIANSIHLAGSHDFLIEHLVKYIANQNIGLTDSTHLHRKSRRINDALSKYV